VFINTEQALDPAYARRLGVDVENLLVSQPDDGEQGFHITEQLVKSRAVDCIVIDSLAALMPEAEVERDVGDDYRAWQGRVLSQAFRRLTRSAAKSKCLLLFLNQTGLRNDHGETTLRLQSSVRLAFRRGQKLRFETQKVGCRTLVKVVKNKFARPFGTAEFDVLFESGVDRLGELLDLGVTLGLVEKKRAWFVLKDLEVGEGGREGLIMGQGREQTRTFLQERSEVAALLEKAVRDKLEGMDSYLDTMPASSSSSFGEEEEEEEEEEGGREGEVRNLAGAAAEAEAAMDEAEQERDGAYAFPRNDEEEEEREQRRRAHAKESSAAPSDSSSQERTSRTQTRMMDPIEHFGAGAGGEGVDLEIDYMTGEVGNAEAAAAAAAAAARQKREGGGGSA
jgi:recombination protein RecA